MEKTALAQEKVWFDKPAYDKAERLYFEKMAKDIMNSTPLPKTKCEKSQDNKSMIIDNAAVEGTRASKTQRKHAKTNKDEDDYNMQKKKNIGEKEKQDVAKNGGKHDAKETEFHSSNNTSKRHDTKEVEEKKNKAETRHRNRRKAKNEVKEVDENIAPVIRNKEQLPTQMDDIAAVVSAPAQTVVDGKKENRDEYNVSQERLIQKLEQRVKALEEKVFGTMPVLAVCPAKPPTAPEEPSEKDEADDVDLFGSDSEGEDAEAAKIREERLAAYAAKKSKKPVLIAKSNIILDVKPWDDETDMGHIETEVRKIECDGLLWGAAKLVPLAFGINKLQISCVVEDDKVSVDWLTETIQELEDYVQSVDIAAFNKV